MRVLVVDDEVLVREALVAALSFGFPDAEVLEAADGDEGARLFSARDPDLVVLDVGLPGRNGYELLREIRLVSDVPVLMLTARAAEIDKVRGLDLGADDYVAKPFSLVELLARVKALLRRAGTHVPAAGDAVSVGELRVAAGGREAWVRGHRLVLTPAEHRLLLHLARDAGRLLPHDTLIGRVWGDRDAASANDLKSLVNRLRTKLGDAPGSPAWIENERGLGYRLVRPRAT